jgi:hypothetical protein
VNPLAIAATSPLQNAGFKLLLLFLFFAFSRVLDVTLPSLHLPFILSVIVLLATLATGGLGRVLASPIGRLLLAFTVWMVICVPFSQWKGGSFVLLKEIWLRSLLCFVMVAGLTLTLRQVRAVLLTLGRPRRRWPWCCSIASRAGWAFREVNLATLTTWRKPC